MLCIFLLQYALIPEAVRVGQRVTLELGETPAHTDLPLSLAKGLQTSSSDAKGLQARLVDPLQPRKRRGLYWGYTIRIANGLSAALTECPYQVLPLSQAASSTWAVRGA